MKMLMQRYLSDTLSTSFIRLQTRHAHYFGSRFHGNCQYAKPFRVITEEHLYGCKWKAR